MTYAVIRLCPNALQIDRHRYAFRYTFTLSKGGDMLSGDSDTLGGL